MDYFNKYESLILLDLYSFIVELPHTGKKIILTLLRMGLFGAANGWEDKKAPIPKICHTYPAVIKLGTVIPYLKKIRKIYESRDTLLEFC